MSKKYRLKRDGSLVEAVRYSSLSRPWRSSDVSRVAKFVLGHDVETRVTISNEHIMDVVRPVESNWAPQNWRADISVADWINGKTLTLPIGWWLVRNSKNELSVVRPSEFEKAYEPHSPEASTRPASEFDILADLIYDHFPWEGETYQAVAEKIAGSIISRGWSRG